MSLSESKSAEDSGLLVSSNMEAIATSMEWDSEQHDRGGAVKEEYHLSAQINEGHDYAVRDVACSGPDLIATLEEKGRVAVFERLPVRDSGASLGSEPAMEWVRKDGVDPRAHASLAFVLENVEGCTMHGEARSSGTQQTHYPRGTMMSGGADKAARPWTANGSSFPSLQGHTGPVNSISCTQPDRMIITGSWDAIVRVWHGDQLLRSFDKLGHAHGTEVLGLEGGVIVTASTTGHIILIDGRDGKVLKRIPDAHSAPIRKLISHPLGFASAANDGLVKIWNPSGTLIKTIHAADSSEVKFLYGVTFIPGSPAGNLDRSRIVTCGEDGFVRVFDYAGNMIQSIPHPGPVRAVKVLGGGGDEGECDFLTACTDKSVRIFTRHASRFAPLKLRKEFKEIGDLVRAAGGMKQLDTSRMEGEEALTKPGNKNGQVKVLNIQGRPNPIAYQWSEELTQWIEIGEALGGAGSGASSSGGGPRQKHEGKEYDFVSDIYLTEDQMVKLAFNAEDDPDEVTDRFCALYQIPQDMRQQIIDFVRPKCDAQAGMRRQAERQSAAAAQVRLQQVPSWTTGSFETYSAANFAAMEKKLRESNTALAGASHPHALVREGETKALAALFASLKDPTQYHVAEFTPGESDVVKHMLNWPTEHSLAVLDCVRVLMVHSGANAALGADPQVHDRVFAHVSEGKKETHKILALKIVSNWIAKRSRSPSERNEPASVPKPVTDYLARALQELSSSASSENENLALAYVMFLHNLICWYGRLRIPQSELYEPIADGVCELLGSRKRNSKIQFYALLTLGSMAYASPAAATALRATFQQPVTAMLTEASQTDNPALQQVAQDCKVLFQL